MHRLCKLRENALLTQKSTLPKWFPSVIPVYKVLWKVTTFNSWCKRLLRSSFSTFVYYLWQQGKWKHKAKEVTGFRNITLICCSYRHWELCEFNIPDDIHCYLVRLMSHWGEDPHDLVTESRVVVWDLFLNLSIFQNFQTGLRRRRL